MRKSTTWFIASAIIAAAMPCNGSAAPINCWLREAQCREYIGKRLWVYIPKGNPNVVEATFTRGDWTTSKTKKLQHGDSFLVTGVAESTIGAADYAVLLPNGQAAWIRSSSPFLIDYDPIAAVQNIAAECARRGQPRIGMSHNELIETCWRSPLRTVKKTTSAGIEESYVYGHSHAVRLLNGKVVEIVESR